MASPSSSYATVASGSSRYDTPTGFELDPPKTPSWTERVSVQITRGMIRTFWTVCLVVVQVSTAVFRMYYWIAERLWLGPCPHKATYRGLAQIARSENTGELREFMAHRAKLETISGFFMGEFLALSKDKNQNQDLEQDLHKHLLKIMQGAQVHLDDGGALFRVWQEHPSASPRRSSHSQWKETIELGHCLFGLVQRGEHLHTCFQFENSPVWGSIMTPIHHLIDYLRYKSTDQNQGPAGSSPHVDHRPLALHVDVDAYFKARENLTDSPQDEPAPAPSPLASPDSQRGREV